MYKITNYPFVIRFIPQTASFLSQANLIIWDEVPMAHRHAIEAVVRTLREI